ncbi:MAG: VOC family protein [Anaerolineae bacterium]|nr:VOC family protein [Anaerolineae bacterium]
MMPVFELRVVLTVDDFNRVAAFYRDGLGLDPGELWTDKGFGQLFRAGRGTLEIFDEDYAGSVDELEVGERVSGPIRFAFEVPDVQAALKRAVDYRAVVVHEPVLTPWNHLNARIQSPEGLQITLFPVMSAAAD